MRNSQIASFRVMARGMGRILVLEIRKRISGGQIPRWPIYQDQSEARLEDGTAGAKPPLPTEASQPMGRGKWQVVGGRKKAGGRQEVVDRRE